jgi:hypothetical protein
MTRKRRKLLDESTVDSIVDQVVETFADILSPETEEASAESAPMEAIAASAPQEYPEHDKLADRHMDNILLQEFLLWLLTERGLVIAYFQKGPGKNGRDELKPAPVGVSQLVREFFGINQEAFLAEHEVMMTALRPLSTDQSIQSVA